MKFFNKKNKICGLIVICFVMMLSFQIVSTTSLNDPLNMAVEEKPKISAQITGSRQWLNNTGFDTSDYWYNETNADISNPDVNATIDNGLANFEILGKTYRKEISDSFDDSWTPFNKTPHSNPFNYGIDDGECWTNYNWDDQDARQTPTIHWRKNVSMDGIDMSDYNITTVSLEAVVNATFNQDVDVLEDTNGPGIPDNENAVYGTGTTQLDQEEEFDEVEFYVEISNLDVSRTFQVAYNNTMNLGEWHSSGDYYLKMQGFMSIEEEPEMIYALTRAFEDDPDHSNFTIILGISIHCADNTDTYDNDEFEDIRFKSLNLTFEYEKMIDEGNYLTWNQDGNNVSSISPYRVVPTAAILKFQYKIDKNWTEYTNTQNSEINIYLNGNPYPIPLS